jgi:hypothetical protein
MKRNRVKAAGVGFALWAGYLHGQDPQPPAVLPVAVRAPGDSTPAPVMPAETVWLPARSTGSKPPVPPPAPVKTDEPPAVVPAAIPNVVPEVVKPAFTPVPSTPAPTASLPIGGVAMPAIPLPDVSRLPLPKPEVAKPEVVVPPASANPPSAFPAVPTVIEPTLPPMVEVPNFQKREVVPDPLPKPKPTIPPSIPHSSDSPAPTLPPPKRVERELPTAPPELMVPTGVPVTAGVPVPGKNGTFGSPGVNISKDYPAVRDLLDHEFSLDWLAGQPNSDNLAADRLEFRAEYLLWWMNAQKIPALATTSVNGGYGFLGDPGTRTLLDPGSFGHSPRSGFRARAGYWFDDCGQCGIDGSFFFLGNQSTSAAFGSNTTPTITRPIYAPNFPGEFGEVVAAPGISTGVLTINSDSKLWGFDLNLRRALCKTCDFHSEVFAGYRGLALDESVTINEFITALPGNGNDPAGTSITVSDNFQTRNRFNGGQVGYYAERQWNRLTLEGRGSIALGNTTQTVEIAGFQSRLRPGMAKPDVFAGGLLATGPNLGTFEKNRFSVVPEFTLNVGYWITPVIKVYAGYNFLYWTNVVRAGDQIDRVVDVTLVPNPPAGVPFSGQYRPQPTFNQTNLLVNGIQFGIMGRW